MILNEYIKELKVLKKVAHEAGDFRTSFEILKELWKQLEGRKENDPLFQPEPDSDSISKSQEGDNELQLLSEIKYLVRECYGMAFPLITRFGDFENKTELYNEIIRRIGILENECKKTKMG